MKFVKMNNLGQKILLLLLLTPAAVFGDAGHDAKQAPAAMEGMDHSKMEMHDTASGEHWMAPAAAAKQRNPVAANRTSIERGRKLFQTHCVSCHGAQGQGDGPTAAALNPKPANLVAMAGQHPDGDFAWKIANGRGAMPGWKQSLKEKQIWDLVNFVQSLGGKTIPRAHVHSEGEHAGTSVHKHDH